MLTHITASANEDFCGESNYLVDRNRVLHQQINKPILLTDHERRTLAEITPTRLLSFIRWGPDGTKC
jgi:hypothetical protein